MSLRHERYTVWLPALLFVGSALAAVPRGDSTADQPCVSSTAGSVQDTPTPLRTDQASERCTATKVENHSAEKPRAASHSGDLQDLALATVSAGPQARLALCTEYTKPDSLRIYLFATPQNLRSPPAA